MSLRLLYNRAVSTPILLLCTVYSTFLLCLQFCFPFLLSESIFCRFSLTFASQVFYLSEKVVFNDCIAFNLKKTTPIFFQQSVYIAVFISLVYLLLTWPSFVRIQFKTLRLVCLISYFYKAFVQFSSRLIELFLKIQRKKILAVFFSLRL